MANTDGYQMIRKEVRAIVWYVASGDFDDICQVVAQEILEKSRSDSISWDEFFVDRRAATYEIRKRAGNAARRFKRRAKRCSFLGDWADELREAGDEGDAATRNELKAAIGEFVAALPEPDQTILRMSLEEVSQEWIGIQLGIPKGTVATKLNRLRPRLQIALKRFDQK